MKSRTKMVTVEMGDPPGSLGNMEGYQRLKALVRLHGAPIGYVELPLSDSGFTGKDLRRIVLRRLARPLARQHLRDRLETPLPPEGLGVEEFLDTPPPAREGPQPLITVAVCTRDRAEDLELCLDALTQLDYPRLEILVVDNAPSEDATERLVKGLYPEMRYVREDRPGLDWARNRAIAEARGGILAYTDDDVVVDSGWAAALAAAFEDPEVMAVTGLVVPYEMETETQILFERYNGFGRGFERRYWRMDLESGERAINYLGAGQYGTGANMAFRIGLFERIGRFDPALDVGTATNGGGDLEMFFRVVREGCLLTYEPNAVARHRHRPEYARLRDQVANNGIGFYSYLVRTALAYPDTRRDAMRLGLSWFLRWSVFRLAKSFIRPPRYPRDLILAELLGSLKGLTRYQKTRRRAEKIAPPNDAPSPAPERKPLAEKGAEMGVRMMDLCQPLEGLDDIASHARVRVFATLDDRPIGSVDIANHHLPVSAARLREAIVSGLGLKLLGRKDEIGTDALWEVVRAELRRRYLPAAEGTPQSSAKLSDEVPVSVVVATYDHPEDLRNCLLRLRAQESRRPVEIVVVDNNPSSGLTPPVVAEFPEVVLTDETRQGLAYARNKGFTASRGDIAVSTDDDVSAPPDWLEKLVAPFAHPDVMVVTGNTLPLQLETAAQRHFERYGGLGRGFVSREKDGAWFDSLSRRAAPTWELGATANAAFRAEIFTHPEIGLMDEALGPGMPTGVGEDTYLFYKVLKAGYTLTYEPSAYVWHRHRREMHALRSQLYNYSKGHVAYHLTTLLRDRDPRAVRQLAIHLPKWHLGRLASYAKNRLLRRERYSLRLILLEVRGNLAGPWCLWKSRQRVEREGRSDPYIPVSRRCH